MVDPNVGRLAEILVCESFYPLGEPILSEKEGILKYLHDNGKIEFPFIGSKSFIGEDAEENKLDYEDAFCNFQENEK